MLGIDRFVSSLKDFGLQFSRYYRAGRPFFAMIDFEMNHPLIIPMEEINPEELLFSFHQAGNLSPQLKLDENPEKISCSILEAPDFETYKKGFDFIQSELQAGNSFLCNYTSKSKIELSHNLDKLLPLINARYLLRVNNIYLGNFLVFSPEIFVRINRTEIFTYPMKGTAPATNEASKQVLLENEKELAEHLTVVDLLRNDLGQIATKMSVPKFKYVERINTINRDLWQMSSEIKGSLGPRMGQSPGQEFLKLLPAGSISGAPKKKTCEIISQAEEEKRGFYTGVAGFFNGYYFDSAVLIRFIEEKNEQYYFRSGGGITIYSEVENEYQEVLDKVYLPTG